MYLSLSSKIDTSLIHKHRRDRPTCIWIDGSLLRNSKRDSNRFSIRRRMKLSFSFMVFFILYENQPKKEKRTSDRNHNVVVVSHWPLEYEVSLFLFSSPRCWSLSRCTYTRELKSTHIHPKLGVYVDHSSEAPPSAEGFSPMNRKEANGLLLSLQFSHEGETCGHRKRPISGVHTPQSRSVGTRTLIILVYLKKVKKQVKLEDGGGGVRKKSTERRRSLSLPCDLLTPYWGVSLHVYQHTEMK